MSLEAFRIVRCVLFDVCNDRQLYTCLKPMCLHSFDMGLMSLHDVTSAASAESSLDYQPWLPT